MADRSEIAWLALASRSPSRVLSFYQRQLGWSIRAVPGSPGFRLLVANRQQPVAVQYRQTPMARAADVAPHWNVIFRVPDLADAMRRAADLGGRALREPFAIPGVGMVAPLEAPGGAPIGLLASTTNSSVPLVSSFGVPGGAVEVQLHARAASEQLDYLRHIFRWRTAQTSAGEAMAICAPPIRLVVVEDDHDRPTAWTPVFLTTGPVESGMAQDPEGVALLLRQA
jgi:uncharacterized protein